LNWALAPAALFSLTKNAFFRKLFSHALTQTKCAAHFSPSLGYYCGGGQVQGPHTQVRVSITSLEAVWLRLLIVSWLNVSFSWFGFILGLLEWLASHRRKF